MKSSYLVQIPTPAKSLLVLKLPHTWFVSDCSKHSVLMSKRACRGTPLTPMPPVGGTFRQECQKDNCPYYANRSRSGLLAALPEVHSPIGRFDNSVKPSSHPMDSLSFLMKRKIGSGKIAEPDPQISAPIWFDKFLKADFQIRNYQNQEGTFSLPN